MLVAGPILWNPSLSWLRDGTIYVSPGGSDWNSGRSPESALATIQRAADIVVAGDLGLSPVLSGPVLVCEDFFLHVPDGQPGAHLKLINPWSGRAGRLSDPIRNVAVERNVFSGKWLCFCTSPMESVRVENNLFADTKADPRFGFLPAVATSGNIFLGTSRRVDTPERACEMKSKVRLAPDGRHAESFVAERPGPAWLDYRKDPASAEFAIIAEEWSRVAGRCD